MKISKRSIIILVAGLVVVLAAFVSLYLEKQSEINDLLNIPEDEDDPEEPEETKEPELKVIQPVNGTE